MKKLLFGSFIYCALYATEPTHYQKQDMCVRDFLKNVARLDTSNPFTIKEELYSNPELCALQKEGKRLFGRKSLFTKTALDILMMKIYEDIPENKPAACALAQLCIEDQIQENKDLQERVSSRAFLASYAATGIIGLAAGIILKTIFTRVSKE